MFWKSGNHAVQEAGPKARRPLVLPDFLGERVTLSTVREGGAESGVLRQGGNQG